MAIETRTLTPDDRAAAHHLRVLAFTDRNRMDPPAATDRYVPDGRRIGVFDGDRIVAHAGAWPMGQFLLGREVPMGGVGGVAVAPELRGHGHGRVAMRALTDLMREQGDVVSMLYPTHPGLYRSMGWEFAGVRLAGRVATSALRDVPAPAERVDVRPLDPAEDRVAVRALLDLDASLGHGRVRCGDDFHDGLLDDPDLQQYVVRRDEEVVGHLAIAKEAPDPDGAAAFRQHVPSLVARDHDTWLALWRIVASAHPVADVTTFQSRPHEPLHDTLRTMALHVQVETMHWMLRLLDVPAAMAGRGWPADVDVEVHLNVLDHWVPANAGPHVLRVVDGAGSLEPGGTGDVSLGVGALAQLHTGFASAGDLAWARRINSPAGRDVAALESAFRSPMPWESRYF